MALRWETGAIMPRPQPLPIGPGQESVWDYPRPPRVEPVSQVIRIVLAGETIVETSGAFRVLETSHPPTYYLPPRDIVPGVLHPSGSRPSVCEWKGVAIYFNVVASGEEMPNAAWAYPHPTPAFAHMADHVAFYCSMMDECWVGNELATPQPGGFYGGWVTSNIIGPMKGGPGSHGW
jgi:uncharacterized protein (DUF427 family)